MHYTAANWPKTLHFYADCDWRDGLGKSTWVGRCVELPLWESRRALERLLPAMDKTAAAYKRVAGNPWVPPRPSLPRLIAKYLLWLSWPEWARWTSRGTVGNPHVAPRAEA